MRKKLKEDFIMKRLSFLIAGALLVTVLFIPTVVLAESQANISVIFDRAKITVNGQPVKAPTILHDGTTYVPLRAIGEMLGKEIVWDANTNIANIIDKGVQNGIQETSTVPAPTPSNYEYTVKDSNGKALYSFKINKITAMSERNEYSEKTPAQVILIDYTYTNISNPEAVYLFDGYFKIIDSKGKIGYSYPNSIVNYPQEIPVGVTCDAQMIFGLDNVSDIVTLNFHQDMFGNITTSFKIAVDK
jgi:hypothetical protein